MAVIAAQRNVSDGNLAVCDSMDFAICLSVCCVVLRMPLPCVVSCGSVATNVPDVMARGRLRCLSTCAPVDAVRTISFSSQESTEGRL